MNPGTHFPRCRTCRREIMVEPGEVVREWCPRCRPEAYGVEGDPFKVEEERGEGEMSDLLQERSYSCREVGECIITRLHEHLEPKGLKLAMLSSRDLEAVKEEARQEGYRQGVKEGARREREACLALLCAHKETSLEGERKWQESGDFKRALSFYGRSLACDDVMKAIRARGETSEEATDG